MRLSLANYSLMHSYSLTLFHHLSCLDSYLPTAASCGLFSTNLLKSFIIVKAGLELVSARPNELSKNTSAPTQFATLELRLLAYLIPESNKSQDFLRTFFDDSIRNTYWASVLEFAVCQGGASWLLSVYWPRLIARLSEASGPSAAPAVSEDKLKVKANSELAAESPIVSALPVSDLNFEEKRILNSSDGILLMLSSLDSTEETRQQSVKTMVALSKLVDPVQNFGRDHDSSRSPLYYAAAKNRSDICTFIMQQLGGATVDLENLVFTPCYALVRVREILLCLF